MIGTLSFGARAAGLLLAVCALVACGGGGGGGGDAGGPNAPPGNPGGPSAPPGPLTLVTSTPTAQATGVSRTDAIVLTFSASLNAATVTANTVSLQSPEGNQPITLATDGARITVMPSLHLLPRTPYTLRVETDVRSAAGDAPSAPVVLTFTSGDTQWQTAALVETDDSGDALAPTLAVDPRGNAFVVWEQASTIGSGGVDPAVVRATRYSAEARTWSTPQNIGSETLRDIGTMRIAVDARGNAIAVWQQETNAVTGVVWTNRYEAANGTWGSAERLSPDEPGPAPRPRDPSIVLGENGAGYALFQMNGSVRVRRYDPVSGWEAPVTLSRVDVAPFVSLPRATIDSDGNVVAIWWETLDSGEALVSRRFDAASGSWSAPAIIIANQTLDGAIGLSIDTDRSGNAFAAWNQSDQGDNNLWVSRYSAADDRWGTATPLDVNLGDSLANGVAFDSEGNAALLWTRLNALGEDLLIARYSAATDSWTESIPLVSQLDVSSPQLAFDVNDDLLVIWEQRNGALSNILSARNLSGSNTWSTPLPIEIPSGTRVRAPRFAINASGSGLAVWEQSNGTRFDIWANLLQ